MINLDTIAKKLISEKRDLILYGAGIDAIHVITKLKDGYEIDPVCLCDSNSEKWHKTLLGINILSIDEAVRTYPDAYIYISTNTYRHQIIGQLTAGGVVSKDRILNYEPVERRKSCVYLESSVVCVANRLYFCCSDFGKNISPSVPFTGDYETTVKEFLRYRRELRNDLRNGVPTPCSGCPEIREDWYPEDSRITLINYSETGVCNFRCCYCTSPARFSKDASKDIDAQKIVEAFRSSGLLSETFKMVIGSGEICFHPNRNGIYDLISERQATVCSNASVYDSRLAQLLELGNIELNCSVDAGTRNTFHKVKGYDLFDKVCENIKRYGSLGKVTLKYIILPGINDNEADIDGFIALCKAAGTGYVQISYDIHAPRELSEETSRAAEYFIGRLSENGLMYQVLSDVVSKALADRKDLQ